MINRAFAPYMDGNAENLQAGYVPLSPFRKEYAKQPTIVALPVPRPYKKMFSMQAVEESLPMLSPPSWRGSSKKVAGRYRSQGIPASEYRWAPTMSACFSGGLSVVDDDVARPYIRALEARSLPHLLVGGKSFHDREEVQTVRAALTAIEWPDDELSVFAT